MDPPPHQQVSRTAAQGSVRGVQSDQKGSGSGLSAQIREAKGLALELKGLLKRKEPWDRTVEFQRESLRKAYLRIVFSSPPPPNTALPSRASAADATLRPRGSSAAPSTSSSSHSTRQLEVLNLLWLDTSHALIQSYRARLAQLDKELAAAPNAHKSKNRSGGGGGDIQPVGPVARRKLAHSFRQFLSQEEDFWRTICGRVASRLYPEEADELRTLGIIASAFSFSETGRPSNGADDGADDDSDDAFKARRAAVLPLAHKALICFGDLARYSELYSESQQQQQQSGGGRGRGKGRGGKQQGQQQERKTKNFGKAAECYNQARLLLPDNGNPSNQLAVLAQYASDSLSSVYHYYRALSVRQPFTTAQANLQITLKKAVAKWFASDVSEAEGDGDEASRFKVAFVALLGVLFTKEHLADFTPVSARVSDLFITCTAERQLTSDVVLKIVVTTLAALWEARMSRSSVSTKASSVAPAASSAAVGGSTSSSGTTEPHLLLHLLSLYTTLLRISSNETNELYTSNVAPLSPSDPPPPLAQNISAVLRRSLPALRILHKWLLAQLEYIGRVEARLEAVERKRARDTRRKARTSTGTEEEAQRASSSFGAEAGESASSEKERERVTVAELRAAMDGLWEAMADYANSMLLAFPIDELPAQPLAGAGETGGVDGVWLEEDVELLGFAPLRRGGSARVEDGGRPREIRRVGRDVHPNEEQLMRIREGQGEVEKLAELALTRFSFDHGAYIFHPRGQDEPSQQSSASLEARRPVAGGPTAMYVDGVAEQEEEGVDEEEEDEEDAEMLDQVTEDDPVDRAMRIDAADKLDMDGLESEFEEDDDEDSDDEQILFEGNRSTSRSSPALPTGSSRAQLTSVRYSTSSFGLSRVPSVSAAPPAHFASTPAAARTADDLRQMLLSGGSPSLSRTTSSTVAPSAGRPPALSTAHLSSPSLSRHASAPVPPPTSAHSIWAPPAAQNGITSAPLFPPTSAVSTTMGPAAAPVTPRSFEAIPNATHGSPAAHAAGWGWSSPGGAAVPGQQPPQQQQQQQQEHQQHQPFQQPSSHQHYPSYYAAPPQPAPPPAVNAATLFGGSSAFSPPSMTSPPAGAGFHSPFPVHSPGAAPPGSSSRTLPLPPPPGFSAAFAGVGPTSPFSSGPFSPNQHGGGGGAWPAMPGNPSRGNGYG
ncbi:hypothetical protein JCM6882_004187 [Rhodosporidiobolus microsporus]